MNKLERCLSNGLIVLLGGVSSLGMYSAIWEDRQQPYTIPQAKVTHIEPIMGGCRVRTEGRSKPIDFLIVGWNKNIKEGDIVDLLVKDAFSYLGLVNKLHGLRVNSDYE